MIRGWMEMYLRPKILIHWHSCGNLYWKNLFLIDKIYGISKYSLDILLLEFWIILKQFIYCNAARQTTQNLFYGNSDSSYSWFANHDLWINCNPC